MTPHWKVSWASICTKNTNKSMKKYTNKLNLFLDYFKLIDKKQVSTNCMKNNYQLKLKIKWKKINSIKSVFGEFFRFF